MYCDQIILNVMCCLFIAHKSVYCDHEKPNIVLIVADDVGRNDIGLHGSSQIPTPNIDALAYNGLILNRHYTMHICTPSRAALLTGNYPIRSGLQGSPIAAGEARSLPTWMPTIAEKLSGLGYSTHLIGKWHLGHENRSVTPLGRGFHTHLGYWSGFVGYFDYRLFEDGVGLGRFDGYDLHDGHAPATYSGIYATDLFTKKAIEIIETKNEKPLFLMINHLAGHTGINGTLLETPNIEEALEKYQYIEETQRRIYADMINRLDSSVGEVIEALDKNGILDNTIIVFMSDNGAQSTGYYKNYGSNWPLRGLKNTLYEGGVRNIATIWTKYLKKKHYIENSLFHIADWMPTLYAAAGGNVSDLGKIDGTNNWPLLTTNTSTIKRNDVLINIDEISGHESILSSNGQFKLVKGQFERGIYDNYFGDSGRSNNTPSYDISSILKSTVNRAISNTDKTMKTLTETMIVNIRSNLEIKQSTAERKHLTCSFNNNNNICLFDLINDPTETTDISSKHPEIVKKLNESLDFYRGQLMPSKNKPVDPNSNPKYCNDTYFTWLDPNNKCVQANNKTTIDIINV